MGIRHGRIQWYNGLISLHVSSCFVLCSSFFILDSSCFVLGSSCFVFPVSCFVLRASCFVLRSTFYVLCKAHAGSLLDQCREERGPTWAWMCEGLCSSSTGGCHHFPSWNYAYPGCETCPTHLPEAESMPHCHTNSATSHHEPERMSTATEMRFYGNNGHATRANAATDLSQHDPSKVGLCCCCYCIGDGRWCLLLLLPTVASCSMLIRVLFCFIALFLHRCRSIAGCFSNSAAKTKI